MQCQLPIRCLQLLRNWQGYRSLSPSRWLACQREIWRLGMESTNFCSGAGPERTRMLSGPASRASSDAPLSRDRSGGEMGAAAAFSAPRASAGVTYRLLMRSRPPPMRVSRHAPMSRAIVRGFASPRLSSPRGAFRVRAPALHIPALPPYGHPPGRLRDGHETLEPPHETIVHLAFRRGHERPSAATVERAERQRGQKWPIRGTGWSPRSLI